MKKKRKNEEIQSPKKTKAAQLSSFHLEVDPTPKGMGLLISGVMGINDFNDNEIKLLTRFGGLTVLGSSLELCIYENNTVSIVGKILETRFGYGKNR